jgi:hypothetical protein
MWATQCRRVSTEVPFSFLKVWFPQIFDSLTSDAERWALPVEDAPLGGTRGTSYQCGGRAALPRSPATPPDAASAGSKIGLWRLWQLDRRLSAYCLPRPTTSFFKRERQQTATAATHRPPTQGNHGSVSVAVRNFRPPPARHPPAARDGPCASGADSFRSTKERGVGARGEVRMTAVRETTEVDRALAGGAAAAPLRLRF